MTFRSVFYLIICITSLVYSCNDEEIFGGDATLKGTVFFQNVLTNTINLANKAKVTIADENKPAGKRQFTVTTNDEGKFEINNLKAGTYKIKIDFAQKNDSAGIDVVYGYEDEKTLIDGVNEATFTMTLNRNKDYHLASISGKVLYTSVATNVQTLANGAKIVFTPAPSSFENNIPNKYEITTNEKGEFVQQFLPGGMFTVTGIFEERVFGMLLPYRFSKLTTEDGNDLPTLMLNQNSPKSFNIILKLDTPNLLTGHVKLKGIDTSGNIIPHAQICLYTSEHLLKADSNGCTGSIRVGNTNASGVVIFGGLETSSNEGTQYFVKASIETGSLQLRNSGEKISVKSGILNEHDIMLQ